MPSGTVKIFFEDKGFGFITPHDGGDDVFVHRKLAGADRTTYLEEGDDVDYEIEYNAHRGAVRRVVVHGLQDWRQRRPVRA